MTQEQLEELTRLRERTRILEDAIRRHRDASGHERCWLNDVALYNALGEGVPASPSLPDCQEFLNNCARYYAEQSGEELKLEATSVVPRIPDGHALLVEVDIARLPLPFSNDAQALSMMLTMVRRTFREARPGSVIAHAGQVRVVGTCALASEVEVAVADEQKLDSPVCDCQFPTVVARNMHGHANDCPVFLDWYEKTFSRPFPFKKETRHEQEDAPRALSSKDSHPFRDERCGYADAIADAEQTFASKLEEGES